MGFIKLIVSSVASYLAALEFWWRPSNLDDLEKREEKKLKSSGWANPAYKEEQQRTRAKARNTVNKRIRTPTVRHH